MTYQKPTLTVVGNTAAVVLGTGSQDPDNLGAVRGLMVADMVAGIDE